ncbi:hypothetical protein Tco_1379108 [Tanacetum coccineum]
MQVTLVVSLALDSLNESVRTLKQANTTPRKTRIKNLKDLKEQKLPWARNLVGSCMDADVTSDVSSSGPVKLADLQRILSDIRPSGMSIHCKAANPNGEMGSS